MRIQWGLVWGSSTSGSCCMSSCIKTSNDSSKSEVSRSKRAFSSGGVLKLMERDLRKYEIGFMGSDMSIGNMDGWGREEAPTVGSGGSTGFCAFDVEGLGGGIGLEGSGCVVGGGWEILVGLHDGRMVGTCHRVAG